MRKRPLLASFAALALAACGAKSPPASTTPPPGAGVASAGGDTGSASDAAPGSDTAPGSGSAVAPPTEPPPPPPPDPAKIKADLLADEQAAYEKARPLFDQYCARCHTRSGKNASKKKLGHFDMTSYPFGGHHTATIGTTIREVLGLSGEKPTMPDDKPGRVKGDDLATIDAWAQAWLEADQGGAHGAKAGADQLDDDKH
jgi:mono/diheme cytochrome c family protein